PGAYDLDVYVNNAWRGKFDMTIANDGKGTVLVPKDDVPLLGIRDLDDLVANKSNGQIDISTLLHGGKSTLTPGELRLDLEVPQAFVVTEKQNWVAPQKWDQGINGVFTNYNLNYYNFYGLREGYTNSDNIYLSLNSGLNMSGWHLLDNSTWMRYSNMGKGYWINPTRYLEKPIVGIEALMRVGRTYTTSDYFDTIRFRGLTLNKS
ncbi:fimbria/pilus outer membrane usher protein, partial [Escherichia coli]